MVKYLLVLLALLATTISADENDKAQYLMVEAEIYTIDTIDNSISLAELLKTATKVATPRVMTIVGKEAMIQIGNENKTGEFADLIEIIINSYADSNTYSIDFNLVNGEDKSISRIHAQPFGKWSVLSTSVAGTNSIIKIKASETDWTPPSEEENKRQIDEAIAARILEEYQQKYRKNNTCPCPQSLKRDGSMCGADSSYFKGKNGRRSSGMVCYRSDITNRMIKAYKKRNNIPD